MKIVSLNVARPAVVKWRGEEVTTSIFKEPVTGTRAVRRHNIEGDEQADLEVHGGELKAIYAYAAEHYPFWRNELGREDLSPGMFGENLTVEGGLLEEEVFVGDRFRVGTATLMAIQPRMPCYKLGIRFGNQKILKQFTQARRYGIYFSIVEEGMVGTGDEIELVQKSPYHVSIRDIGRIILDGTDDVDLIRRASAIPVLPRNFLAHFQKLLEG